MRTKQTARANVAFLGDISRKKVDGDIPQTDDTASPLDQSSSFESPSTQITQARHSNHIDNAENEGDISGPGRLEDGDPCYTTERGLNTESLSQNVQVQIDSLISATRTQAHVANVGFLGQLEPSKKATEMPLTQSYSSNVHFLTNFVQANEQFMNNVICGSLNQSSMATLDGARSRQPQNILPNFRGFTFLQNDMTFPHLSNLPDSEPTQALFQYPSLSKAAARELRLIKFEHNHGFNSNAIFCKMVCADPWTQDYDYRCLSYCWGEGGKTQEIYIDISYGNEANYRSFLVTENLFNALRSLSGIHDTQWLWIDAISINQNDLEERSAQVAMMKDIYNNATGVTIWLGTSEAAVKAHPIISSISDRFTRDTKCPPASIIGPEGLTLSSAHLNLLKQYTTSHIANKEPMRAYEDLATFFSLPWFRRVWVLQEAFSHTSVTAQVGTLPLPWGSIILAALWQSFLTRTYTAISKKDARGGYLPELWLSLLHNRTPRGLSMVELVCRARDFDASDPRDKVFALLGLANDIDPKTVSSNLRPDYTKSKIEVYTGFTRDIILKTGNLDILSAINTFTPTPRYITWMPDLDVSIATIRGLGFPKKYNASYSTSIDHTITISNFYTPSVLSLSGYVLNTVSATVSPLLTLSKDLRLHIGGKPDAILTLWKYYLNQPPSSEALTSYIHTLTSAGFALPTQFPAHPLGRVIPPQDVPSLISDFAAHIAATMPKSLALFPNPEHLTQLAVHGDSDQFAVLTGKACHERRFFLTEDGRMGLCPRNAKEGDKVVVLFGGSVLYVLREEVDGRWGFIGECYVDGMMFGEVEGKGEGERVFNIG